MGADKEANFLTKNLNKWVSSRITFIKDATYCENMGEIDINALKGKICYGGLDLASVNDTNAFCLYFPEQDGLNKPCAIWWYWIPEDNVRDRVSKDAVPYLDWINDGYIITTPGNVTDYNILKHEIMQIAEMYDICSVGYDRWNSSQLVIDLLEEGLPFEKFGQGFGSMNAPTKEYQRLMLTNSINVGKNPVSRWHNSNIELDVNPAGDIKITKAKSTEKVDGMIALIMAMGEKMDKHNNQGSVYDDRDIIIL
jgi:phage terminase large subunit-like protein